MQAERNDKVVEFRCERCDATVVVGPTGKKEGASESYAKPAH